MWNCQHVQYTEDVKKYTMYIYWQPYSEISDFWDTLSGQKHISVRRKNSRVRGWQSLVCTACCKSRSKVNGSPNRQKWPGFIFGYTTATACETVPKSDQISYLDIPRPQDVKQYLSFRTSAPSTTRNPSHGSRTSIPGTLKSSEALNSCLSCFSHSFVLASQKVWIVQGYYTRHERQTLNFRYVHVWNTAMIRIALFVLKSKIHEKNISLLTSNS